MMRITPWLSSNALLLCALMAITALLPGAARADGLSDCTVQSAQLLGPEHDNKIVVKPYAFAVGDPVGGSRFFLITYRCKNNGSSFQWGIFERQSPGTINTGTTARPPGLGLHPVLTTPQLQSLGLGFVGYYYENTGIHWPGTNTTIYNANTSTPSLWMPPFQEDGTGYALYPILMRHRLVKINNNLDAILNTTPFPSAFPVASVAIGDDQGYFSPVQGLMIDIPTLTIEQRACTPFAQKTVPLPSVEAAELPSIGSTGQPTSFTFTVRCPHNGAMYGYYVEAVHGYEDEALGVIKLDPASTAKGIAVQVTTRQLSHPYYPRFEHYNSSGYHPIKFGPTNNYGYALVNNGRVGTNPPLTYTANYTFPNLPSTMGEGPLQVAVYRTGTLVPGAYTAALRVYIVYR